MRKAIIRSLILLLILVSRSEALTLEESINFALEQNPQIIKTRAEISAAEGVAGQAVAGLLPNFSLSGNVGKYYSKPITVQMTIAGTPSVFSYGTDEQADLTSYGLSLSQSIFTGGKLLSSISMANKELLAAKEEFKKISQEVKFNVIEAYYNVLKAKKIVALNEESVAMAESHRHQVKTLLRVGTATQAEVLRSQVQLAQAKLALTRSRQTLEIAKNQFNHLLGKDLDEAVELSEIKVKEENKVPLYDDKDLLTIGYENRPDWRQYLLGKGAAEDEVRLAYSGLYPNLALAGNLDSKSIKYSSYQSDGYSWTALISGSWNLFDGTATWNKIKEAQAKLAARKAEEVRIKQGIALEIKNVNFALKSAVENLESCREALEAAEENYKFADSRYKSGLGTNLEVIDAQVALTSTKINYYQALFDLEIAKAKLNKVVGKEII